MKTGIETDGHVVLVTGPSGAGRTTAIQAFEDAGFMAIDNMPLTLVPRLFEGPKLGYPLVLGVDTRNRDFSIAQLIETIDTIPNTTGMQLDVLYLDCAVDVLLKRFSATRRRHPMAPEESPLAGIRRELDLLTPIQARADVLIDTTEMSPHQLRAEVERWFAPDQNSRLAVAVHSFSYKRGVPRGVDMIFDCRFLRNPYWDVALRELDGRDAAVQDYVRQDPRYEDFLARVQDLVHLVIPAHVDEGRTHVSIAFGCSGGQHRSVTMAETLWSGLSKGDWHVTLRHRELERRGRIAAAPGKEAS